MITAHLGASLLVYGVISDGLLGGKLFTSAVLVNY